MRPFMNNRRGRAPRVLAMVALLAVTVAAASAVVMLLWNWLMPALFVGVKTVDFWQALGLLLLSKILLGGGWLHRKMHSRWDGMSAEERDELKRHFKSRWEAHWGTREGRE